TFTIQTGTTLGGASIVSGGSVSTSGDGVGIQASGLSTVGYSMARLAAPTVVIGGGGSCASNCVASGTYFYSVIANDVAGRWTGQSSASASVTVNGTQTVTVTLTPVNGGVSWNPCRGTSANNTLCSFSIGQGGNPTNNTYTDGTNQPASLFTPNTYSNPGPNIPTANAESLTSAGVSEHTLNLSGGGFNNAIVPPSAGFTASRTTTIPNVNSIVPTSSYQNSAYDNATHVNDAIGSNWTVTNNGINIASNNFVNTASTNDA